MAENAIHQRARGADIALRRQTAIDLGAGKMTCHGRIRRKRISERRDGLMTSPSSMVVGARKAAASTTDAFTGFCLCGIADDPPPVPSAASPTFRWEEG